MRNMLPAFVVFLFLVAVSIVVEGEEPLGIAMEGYAYPFPVQFVELSIAGEKVKMAYMDVQPSRSNSKTVVLLHGKNFFGAYWGQVIKDLSDHGYRVIVPDQVGFGKSSKPVFLQYTFELLATNTRRLLDHLGVTRAIVLGHSMGGMLATRFALMYPQRIEKLILENPIGLED
jgi:pimeloyl-ACP methyl ester carboxylesterase